MNAQFWGSSQLASARSLWFWATVAVGLAIAIVTLLPTLNEPWYTSLRLASSLLLVFWLPGYCFTKALFPRGRWNSTERALLSVAMSIVLVPVVVLLLDETSVGLEASSLVSSLLMLSMVCVTVALLREWLRANSGP